MFHSHVCAEVDLSTGEIVIPPLPQPQRTLREEHAHLLAVAAARRLRAAQRMGVQRHEDAEYWKAVAPSAVHKAHALREHPSFAPIPG